MKVRLTLWGKRWGAALLSSGPTYRQKARVLRTGLWLVGRTCSKPERFLRGFRGLAVPPAPSKFWSVSAKTSDTQEFVICNCDPKRILTARVRMLQTQSSKLRHLRKTADDGGEGRASSFRSRNPTSLHHSPKRDSRHPVIRCMASRTVEGSWSNTPRRNSSSHQLRRNRFCISLRQGNGEAENGQVCTRP
jgi:hypothetical protein